MTKVEQESYDWFQKQVNQYRLKKDLDTDYNKMERRSISNSSMVSFSYKNPIGKTNKRLTARGTPKKPSLKFYDENPLDIILDIKGNDMWCINLHFIPRPFRETLYKMVVKLNKQRIKNDKRFVLSYQDIKEFLVRNSLQMSIKRYKINRITNLKYIKGSEVKYAMSLPSEKFIIQDSNMSEDDLYRMIRSGSSQVKKSKNIRTGRNVNSRTSSSRTKRK